MARQVLTLGASPNDGGGESLRSAGTKINAMTAELYAGLGSGGGGGTPAPFMVSTKRPWVSGTWGDNGLNGGGITTVSLTVDAVYLAPVYFAKATIIDAVAVRCSTASAGAFAKVVAYSPDSAGWPGTRVLQSAALDLSAVATVQDTTAALTVAADSLLWLGLHSSATGPVVSALNAFAAYGLGFADPSVSAPSICLRRTSVAYGSGAPASWSFTSADVMPGGNGINPPSIRYRIAAA